MEDRKLFSAILDRTVDTLDIPAHQSALAERLYHQVGKWLEERDLENGRNPSSIYPQGSSRLGTATRSASGKTEQDIDLVYQRDIRKESTTQTELKKQAGDALRGYVRSGIDEYKPELVEGRRCWTLLYKHQFHMDILPAIPDLERGGTSILITDRELTRWQHSNPKGYSAWFYKRMEAQYLEKRAALADRTKRAAESIPDWEIKTPLQRAIQLFKQHRDRTYRGDKEDCPISIIITTLAAHAYRGEADLYEAIEGICHRMPEYIEERNGIYWVANPAHPEENFADKWEKHPARRAIFINWLHRMQEDMLDALSMRGIHRITESLSRSFGKETMVKVAESFGADQRELSRTGALTMAPATGRLGTSGSLAVRPHTFYGSAPKS